jgi:hypothetical protein
VDHPVEAEHLDLSRREQAPPQREHDLYEATKQGRGQKKRPAAARPSSWRPVR